MTIKSLAMAVLILLPGSAWADGHGPLFGLATPTLADDQWSSDTGLMKSAGESGGRWRLRQMIGYGLTEDLQLGLSLPLDSREGSSAPNARGGAMMGQPGTVEASLLWRVHREAPTVGQRRESSLLLGLATQGDRFCSADRDAGESLHAAVVTGYASRITYWWLGGGGQWYRPHDGARRGALYYATAVFGWRPPLFRADYPKPDWRLFVEAVAEQSLHDRIDGVRVTGSGGTRVLAGPSVLGLYGAWGVSAGVLLPIEEDLDRHRAKTGSRAKLVVTYWF